MFLTQVMNPNQPPITYQLNLLLLSDYGLLPISIIVSCVY